MAPEYAVEQNEPKRSYEPPQIVALGDSASMTRGGAGAIDDGMGYSEPS